MPWHITKGAGCPASKPFAVVKDSDGSVSGCHPTKAKAQAQLAALYANEGESMSAATAPRTSRPPRDGLVRARPGLEVRSAEDDSATLTGHFAVFDEWTEIDSVFEGRFLERIAPGAFKKTLSENPPKVLFQHGHDPHVGDKPIAKVTDLREDERGAYYEAELFDGLPDLVVDGLRAGEYGASFRFRVVKEDYERDPERSEHNPEAIPERTISEAQVMEFGPVTWPAYEGATSGVRSMTDELIFEELARNPERLRQLLEFVLGPERSGDEGDGAGATHSDQDALPKQEEPAQATPPPRSRKPAKRLPSLTPTQLNPPRKEWQLP